MCLGIPMRVLGGDEFSALCAGRGKERRVSMLLVGAQAAGSWVLVHIDSAIRVIDAAEAALIDEALDALEAVLREPAFGGAT